MDGIDSVGDPEVELRPAVWQPMVLRNHADVLELRERGRFLSSSASYSASQEARGKTETHEALRSAMVTRLVLQALRERGLRESASALEQECPAAAVLLDRDVLPSGALEHLLSFGVAEGAKDLWDPTTDTDLATATDSALPQDELLPQAELVRQDVHPSSAEDESSETTSGGDLVMGSGSGSLPSACTLTALVRFLTSAEVADLTGREVVLYTLTGFATPKMMLRKLVQRYNLGGSSSEDTKMLKLRVCTLLRYWMETFPLHWGPEMCQELIAFIEQNVRDEDAKLARLLRSSLERRNMPPKEFEPSVYLEPLVGNVANLFTASLTLRDVEPEEIARQVTVLEAPMLREVTCDELLTRGWADARNAMRDCPAVMAVVNRHNLFCRWLVASILQPTRPDDRAKVLAHYVRVADHLRRLQNFHTLFTVHSALRHSAVARLKNTLAALPQSVMRQLGDLDVVCARENSFAAYRANYRQAMLNVPALPSLLVVMRDLEIVMDAYPQKAGALINMVRWQAVFNAITPVAKLCAENSTYPFQRIHQIAVLLGDRSSVPSDDELYERSLLMEPRART